MGNLLLIADVLAIEFDEWISPAGLISTFAGTGQGSPRRGRRTGGRCFDLGRPRRRRRA